MRRIITLTSWSFFALILGVLIQGSEYAWGTNKTAQTQLPGRLTIVGAQLVSITLLLLLVAGAAFLCDALASYLIALLDGKSTTFPAALDIVKGVGAMWLIFDFMAILGFGLATIFRQSAMAMGLGLGYVLVIESLVFDLLVNLGDTFKQVHEWFPIANAGYLQQSFGQVRGVASFANTGPAEVDATHAVIALALWIIGIALIAGTLVRRRDVT